MNLVVFMGNLTRDVELRHVGSDNKSVAKLNLAVNNPFNKERTTFIDVTVWNSVADSCNAHLSKGSRVLIKGRLEQESWEDKESGQKRSKHVVVAESVEFLNTSRNQSSESETTQRDNQDSEPVGVGAGSDDNESVPF